MRIDIEIQGVPCIADVSHVYVEEPNRHADNPDDYFGYAEVEFEIFDTAGRPDPKLEALMTSADVAAVEAEAVRIWTADREADRVEAAVSTYY